MKRFFSSFFWGGRLVKITQAVLLYEVVFSFLYIIFILKTVIEAQGGMEALMLIAVPPMFLALVFNVLFMFWIRSCQFHQDKGRFYRVIITSSVCAYAYFLLLVLFQIYFIPPHFLLYSFFVGN